MDWHTLGTSTAGSSVTGTFLQGVTLPRHPFKKRCPVFSSDLALIQRDLYTNILSALWFKIKAKSKKLSNNIAIITYVIHQKTIKSLLKSLIYLNVKITYTLSVKKSGNSFYLYKSEDRRGGWKKLR